jgi:hypothetical protein
MNVLGGLVSIGAAVACCGVLFAIFCVALVLWYWRRQPNQVATSTAPAPPIQASIEHPTAANMTAPVAPVPVDLSAPSAAPAEAPVAAPPVAPAPTPEPVVESTPDTATPVADAPAADAPAETTETP